MRNALCFAVRNPAQFRLGGAEFEPAYHGHVIA